MRALRRKDRSITQNEAMALLTEAEYGVLSTADEDGKPYGVPLSLCVVDNAVYFHCAVEGQKIDHIQQNRWVSLCVVGKTELLPDKFSTKYESVIVAGEAEEVFQSEKQQALKCLVYKYSSGFIEEGKKYIDVLYKKTRVFKISINHISGKARRQ
jgi:hypothetical protein